MLFTVSQPIKNNRFDFVRLLVSFFIIIHFFERILFRCGWLDSQLRSSHDLLQLFLFSLPPRSLFRVLSVSGLVLASPVVWNLSNPLLTNVPNARTSLDVTREDFNGETERERERDPQLYK